MWTLYWLPFLLKKKLKEERFVLIHSLGVQSIMTGEMWSLCTPIIRKQREMAAGTPLTFSFCVHSRSPDQRMLLLLFGVVLSSPAKTVENTPTLIHPGVWVYDGSELSQTDNVD